jgi:hypothetical protein
MRRTVVAAVVGALTLAGCYSSGDSVSLPQIEHEFPSSVKPGSAHDMSLTVTNPGPEPMGAVVVTFVRVGNFFPIVDGAARGRNPAILSIDPEPLTVDRAAVVYQFEGLGDGESRTITFRLMAPTRRGIAGNSVQVSDGSDVRRIRGVRLETRVEG